MNIGILEVEDSVDMFYLFIRESGFIPKRVGKALHLRDINGLIIAGSNSLLLDDEELKEEIIKKTISGMPIYALCAGITYLAKNIEGEKSFTLGLMDITVRTYKLKNNNKFLADLIIPVLGEKPVKAEFNNSPYIVDAKPNVGILATYVDNIVMARQGNFLVSSFYSTDRRICRYFFNMVKDSLSDK